MNFQFKDNNELQKEFQRNEAPHHILGKQGLWTPLEEKYKLLYPLINRIIDRNSWRGQIQLYLSGYVEFETTIHNPALFKTNNNYRVFKINNNKSEPEEQYFSGLNLKNILSQKNLSRTETESSIKNLNFYGIPEIVKHNGNEIEIKKALQLLKYFSAYKGPAERTSLPDKSFIINNQGDKQFIELFGSNESITLYDFEQLSKGIATYFKWDEKEAKSIFSFLTLDITSSDFPHNWISKPFLKFDNQVLWIGSFLKDRRWENIFLNKLKRDSEFQPLVNVLAKNFETKIEELFKNHSFKTISSLRFQSSNGQSGDFDVLAFKDNYLIVCEAKTGIRSDEFDHAAKTEAGRLDGYAVHQLEKAIYNIKENWTELKSKLGISDAIEINAINIVPLIVTDLFEGDLRLYKNSILKTSLIELDVNLKNRKKDLLEMYILMQSFSNNSNTDFKGCSQNSINWDLWNGQNECSVENLIQNIQQNAIWKELEAVWKFEDIKTSFEY